MAEGLSRSLREAKRMGTLKGIKVTHQLFITHLMFVDYVLIFYLCSATNTATIINILKLFSKATRMDINIGKSIFSTHLLSATEL